MFRSAVHFYTPIYHRFRKHCSSNTPKFRMLYDPMYGRYHNLTHPMCHTPLHYYMSYNPTLPCVIHSYTHNSQRLYHVSYTPTPPCVIHSYNSQFLYHVSYTPTQLQQSVPIPRGIHSYTATCFINHYTHTSVLYSHTHCVLHTYTASPPHTQVLYTPTLPLPSLPPPPSLMHPSRPPPPSPTPLPPSSAATRHKQHWSKGQFFNTLSNC